MIIDSHTHMPMAGPTGLVSALKSYGVDKAVVFTTEGFYSDCRTANDRLVEGVRGFPGILYPWATVDPYEGEGAVQELRRCVKELGMLGLKLHPWLQGFSVANPAMDLIMEEVVSLGIPILFHDGSPPYATPLQIANLARRHPQVIVILGHGGLRELWKDALRAAEELENIWLCTSGVPLAGLQTMVDRLGCDRIVFGSDAGGGHPSVIPYRLRFIEELKISDAEREKIFGGNIARLLGL